jgi:hypothetical protein
MAEKDGAANQIASLSRSTRLPGFIADGDDIRLGDAIKRVTGILGIQPCGGCQKRSEKLNRWFAFSVKRKAR